MVTGVKSAVFTRMSTIVLSTQFCVEFFNEYCLWATEPWLQYAPRRPYGPARIGASPQGRYTTVPARSTSSGLAIPIAVCYPASSGSIQARHRAKKPPAETLLRLQSPHFGPLPCSSRVPCDCAVALPCSTCRSKKLEWVEGRRDNRVYLRRTSKLLSNTKK